MAASVAVATARLVSAARHSQRRIEALGAGAAWRAWRQQHAVAAAAAVKQQASLHAAASRQQQQGGDEQPSQLEQIIQNARLTHIVHGLLASVLRKGDTVVDATCGNGHDTAFLARAVGPTGTVHAFDVQAAAIDATRQLLSSSIPPAEAPALHYHQQSHAEMLQHVPSSSARAVVFNLGYLPGSSDRATTTQERSTLAAVEAACEALRPGGVCSILCYTGHPGGMEEYEAVRAYTAALPPSSWVSSELRLLNRPTAPVLVLLWKRT